MAARVLTETQGDFCMLKYFVNNFNSQTSQIFPRRKINHLYSKQKKEILFVKSTTVACTLSVLGSTNSIYNNNEN